MRKPKKEETNEKHDNLEFLIPRAVNALKWLFALTLNPKNSPRFNSIKETARLLYVKHCKLESFKINCLAGDRYLAGLVYEVTEKARTFEEEFEYSLSEQDPFLFNQGLFNRYELNVIYDTVGMGNFHSEFPIKEDELQKKLFPSNSLTIWGHTISTNLALQIFKMMVWDFRTNFGFFKNRLQSDCKDNLTNKWGCNKSEIKNFCLNAFIQKNGMLTRGILLNEPKELNWIPYLDNKESFLFAIIVFALFWDTYRRLKEKEVNSYLYSD